MITHDTLIRAIKPDGTPRPDWRKPIPPPDAWFDVDGQEWATNGSCAVTRAAAKPKTIGGVAWCIIADDAGIRKAIDATAAQSKTWGDRARVILVTDATRTIRDAIQARGGVPHPGVFDVMFAPILQAATYVRTPRGFLHALAPAYCYGPADELIAVIMPLREGAVGETVCSADGRAWTVTP